MPDSAGITVRGSVPDSNLLQGSGVVSKHPSMVRTVVTVGGECDVDSVVEK